MGLRSFSSVLQRGLRRVRSFLKTFISGFTMVCQRRYRLGSPVMEVDTAGLPGFPKCTASLRYWLLYVTQGHRRNRSNKLLVLVQQYNRTWPGELAPEKGSQTFRGKWNPPVGRRVPLATQLGLSTRSQGAYKTWILALTSGSRRVGEAARKPQREQSRRQEVKRDVKKKQKNLKSLSLDRFYSKFYSSVFCSFVCFKKLSILQANAVLFNMWPMWPRSFAVWGPGKLPGRLQACGCAQAVAEVASLWVLGVFFWGVVFLG